MNWRETLEAELTRIESIQDPSDDNALRRLSDVVRRMRVVLATFGGLVAVPRDFFGKSIPEAVIYDVVDKALFGQIQVVPHHLRQELNAFVDSPSYESAIALAGLAMRFAFEHQSLKKT